MRSHREARPTRGSNPVGARRWTSAVIDKMIALRERTKAPRAEPKPRPARRPARAARPAGRPARALAWGVHLYTAMGLVVAAAVGVLLIQGGPEAYRWSFALMALATLIDATDGTLARRARVKEVLPNFDGRKLDDITDFLTYTFMPLMLVWRAGLLPAGAEWCLLLPLLASAYGFCQESAKTDDGYFLGFPSLWNVVAFYLYVLQLPGVWALAVVLVLAALTFVPSRYIYPSSRPGRLNAALNLTGAAWGLAVAWVLYALPPHDPAWVSGRDLGGLAFRAAALGSLAYPALYLGASWWVTVGLWRRSRSTRPAAAATR